MTPRDLLIGVWPWSLPDETASQGADMVLKTLDVAGYVIVERAEIERLRTALQGALSMVDSFAFGAGLSVAGRAEYESYRRALEQKP